VRRRHLGDDDLDHPVNQRLLARHVVVEGHRLAAEPVGDTPRS
jgi:hypothetical protein